jgi:hypothetical protein
MVHRKSFVRSTVFGSLYCLLRLFLLAIDAHAQAARTDVQERISAQRVDDPFALTTLGVDTSGARPSDAIWIPGPDGSFLSAEARGLSQLAIQIGGVHFFGHADIFVNIPVYSFESTLAGSARTRQAKMQYFTAAGVKLYPLALRPRTVRPFLSSGFVVRRFWLEESAEPLENTGLDRRFVLPVGAGVALRWDPLILDAQIETTFFDEAYVRSGQIVEPLENSETRSGARRLDLSGIRVSVGLKAVFDASSAIVDPDFPRREAAAMQKRIEDGTANAWNVAVGPSTRIWAGSSEYFQRRPYLEYAHEDRLFPHAALGVYHYGLDAEVRLAYRSIFGEAQAFGAELETAQHGVFLEAIKLQEIGLYGFVPFAGLGVGMVNLDVRDQALGVDHTNVGTRAVLSVPFGWDVRIRPSDWWLLRTNLRWLPSAKLEVANGVSHDFGGLEFDIIQLLIYPERVIW